MRDQERQRLSLEDLRLIIADLTPEERYKVFPDGARTIRARVEEQVDGSHYNLEAEIPWLPEVETRFEATRRLLGELAPHTEAPNG